jgi:hypothetical protein
MKLNALSIGNIDLEKKDIIKLFAVIVFLLGFIAFASGYILGYSTSQKDIYTYLEFWKIKTDCQSCNNYNPFQVQKTMVEFENKSGAFGAFNDG